MKASRITRMRNAKVGDFIKLSHWGKFYEVVGVDLQELTILNSYGNKIRYHESEWENREWEIKKSKFRNLRPVINENQIDF
jgi:hypothetical protein